MADNWLDAALDTVARNMRLAGYEPVGYRRNGRPIWPMVGSTQPPAPAPAPSPQPVPAPQPGPAPAPDPGFPAGTPLEQMTVEQREAYWKFHARKHEDRAKAFEGLTPEALAEMREKASKHDALQLELGTTAEQAAAKAAQEAETKERERLQPQLIASKLETAAALAGVAEADLQTAVAFVDPKKFLNANGNVDADKVKAFVAQIKPATGTPGTTPPKGPPVTGHGAGGPATPPAGSAKEKGLAEARRRGLIPQQPGTTP